MQLNDPVPPWEWMLGKLIGLNTCTGERADVLLRYIAIRLLHTHSQDSGEAAA